MLTFNDGQVHNRVEVQHLLLSPLLTVTPLNTCEPLLGFNPHHFSQPPVAAHGLCATNFGASLFQVLSSLSY